jgi:viologen exporter family transport system permease protein
LFRAILEISTIVFIVYSFEYFLGGQMFPIDIMPTGIQAAMKWLPFYYELFCPVAIFLERLRGNQQPLEGQLRHRFWKTNDRVRPTGCVTFIAAHR